MNGNCIQAVIGAARQGVWRVVLLALLLALGACAGTASQPKLVFHSFSFDGWTDKWYPQTELIAYSYGDQYRMVRKAARSPEDSLGPGAGVSGLMPVGEFLYVKWRTKATGDVHEDRVDLRPLLPADMGRHSLTFVIEGRQLYVYLATPKAKHEKDPPRLKTTMSKYYVTYEIYPTNTYKP